MNIILIFCRCCDNGPEFKGSVKELCKTLGVRIIHGRPYHPQTQGSVERANRTFKKRLLALQMAKGTSRWVELLPELALTINTTTSHALPRRKTPFEVWFSCKFHWLSPQPKDPEDNDQDEEDDDLEDIFEDNAEDTPDLVLSEIEARVAANNANLTLE